MAKGVSAVAKSPRMSDEAVKAKTGKDWKQWFAEGLVERKATANKSMRVTWNDRKTSLEIDFYPKGKVRSQVVVQHSKLPDASAAARMKKF